MSPGVVVTIILVVGIALVVVATLVDRRADKLTTGPDATPRLRPAVLPGSSEQDEPDYLSTADLLANAPAAQRLDAAQERELTTRLAAATRIGCRLATPALATHTGTRVILDRPLVLVCADTVTDLREILRILGIAAQDRRALLVAAPAMVADVLETITANRLGGKLAVAVVFGAPDALAELAQVCRTTPVSQPDRQAGLPRSTQLGHCDQAVADQQATWLLTAEAATSDDTPADTPQA